ncbi:ATP-binding protein [Neobacillus niacini]|uniref:ATP-binding protein n=1 Tax=Neobacillus niacini TaxID=86668 RepID=UPI003F9A7444
MFVIVSVFCLVSKVCNERASVMITTNLEFTEWTSIFGDEKMTAALLDRLTHRAHILLLNGESYRFRQSMKQRDESDQ